MLETNIGDMNNKLDVLLLFMMLILLRVMVAAAQDCNDELKAGEGTYYTGVDGGEDGNCNLFVQEGDFYHAALNPVDYANSNACGACIEVMGSRGTVKLQVVDSCPECKEGDVDMTEAAFAKIARVIDGRVPIQWKYVPCFLPGVQEKIKVHFKKESEMYWTAVQFRNINHAVKKVFYRTDDHQWVAMQREDYNYFIKDGGIPSPMDLKITSIFDEEIIFENLNMLPGQEIETNKQFNTPAECMNSLSLNEYLYEEVDFYPNPTNGIINVMNNGFREWKVRDISGKLIKKGSGSTVDIATFDNGMYLLQIDKGSYSWVIKR